METLELRRMFQADSGTAWFYGDMDFNDSIPSLNDDGICVVQGADHADKIQVVDSKAGITVSVENARDGYFPFTSGIHGILVNAKGGNDTIEFHLSNLGRYSKFKFTVYGDAGNDTLTGTAYTEIILGGEGNDIIRGNGGNDRIHGNADDDVIRGGSGNDRLWGDDGNDRIFGDAGKDILYGGSGTNVMSGGAAADRFLQITPDDEVNDLQTIDQMTRSA